MSHYACPRCSAVLNPEHAIVLKAVHGQRQILLGLDPTPGNYQIYLAPTVTIEPGSKWDFFCPVCQADLAAEGVGNENLCALKMAGEGEDHQVFFSRIAGEQATYVVNAAGQSVAHGKAAESYSQAIRKYLV